VVHGIKIYIYREKERKKRECVCDCEDTLERIEQRLDEIEEHLNNREADYDGNNYEDEVLDDYIEIEDDED
jgi:hypothetical protein